MRIAGFFAFISFLFVTYAKEDFISKLANINVKDMEKIEDTLRSHHPELSSRLDLLKECPPDQYADCLLHLVDDDSLRTEINEILHITKLVGQDASECVDEECRRHVLKNAMPNVVGELKRSMGSILGKKGVPEGFDIGALDSLFDLLHRTDL